MAITGYLAEFSLAEIFQFLEQGHKTGLLTIVADTQQRPPLTQGHYIWFRQGTVVAAANRSDGEGLTELIDRRGWLGNRALSRLAQSCPSHHPLGLYLKSQGILAADQLKLLFYTQVMRQVCALFAMEDGSFHFDAHAAIPGAELTGLSAPASEVALAGLRILKDWSALADKLPDANSALVSVIQGKPHLRLKALEWQIWEFTDGHTPIHEIAAQLNLPIEKVRQIALRLILVGLMEELPQLGHPEPELMPDADIDHLPVDAGEEAASPKEPQQDVGHSFLQSLLGFLTTKL
jgi:hypothetical protein